MMYEIATKNENAPAEVRVWGLHEYYGKRRTNLFVHDDSAAVEVQLTRRESIDLAAALLDFARTQA